MRMRGDACVARSWLFARIVRVGDERATQASPPHIHPTPAPTILPLDVLQTHQAYLREFTKICEMTTPQHLQNSIYCSHRSVTMKRDVVGWRQDVDAAKNALAQNSIAGL